MQVMPAAVTNAWQGIVFDHDGTFWTFPSFQCGAKGRIIAELFFHKGVFNGKAIGGKGINNGTAGSGFFHGNLRMVIKGADQGFGFFAVFGDLFYDDFVHDRLPFLLMASRPCPDAQFLIRPMIAQSTLLK